MDKDVRVTRRRFLGISLGSVAVPFLSGCIGGDEQQASSDVESVEMYNSAVDQLLENKYVLEDWALRGPSFDGEELDALQERLDNARTSLNEAENQGNVPDHLSSKISYVRDVGELQQRLLDYYTSLKELNGLTEEADQQTVNRDYGEAAETYSEGRNIVSRMRNELDGAEGAYASVEPSNIDESALTYQGGFLDHVDVSGPRTLDGWNRFLEGSEKLNTAFAELDQGLEQWRNDDYSSASKNWKESKSTLNNSRTLLKKVTTNDQSPQTIASVSEDRLDDIESVNSALTNFTDATQEARSGNTDQAQKDMQDGYDILGTTSS